MEIDDICNLNLNDSDIVEIRVNRCYDVELKLNLIMSYDTQETEPCILLFQDCQSASFDLKLAYSGPNSILSGTQIRHSDGFVEYVIETNTTASKIRVTSRKLFCLKAPSFCNDRE